jgi:hypothetical protein
MDRQAIDQAAFELDLYGFTVLPSVIAPAEALRLAEVLDEADARIGVEYVYDGAYARSVPCAPALDDGFMALVDNPIALAVVERIMGAELVLGSMNARIVRPGDPGQGLHSDIPAVHRRVTGTPVMLQVVWMLDGFTAEKGATRIDDNPARASANRAGGQRDDLQRPVLARRRGKPQPGTPPRGVRALSARRLDALPDRPRALCR